jgi:hypothetical protein
MDIERLYYDYNIDFLTEGHKHCRTNWVHTPCPFCTGNPGYHLGFNMVGDYFVCWRCGWKPIPLAISKLTRLPEVEVRKIIKGYGIISSGTHLEVLPVPKQPHLLPSHTEPMNQYHKKYLKKRGFDPEKLEREWNLMGTGPIATLDNGKEGKEQKLINYKSRVLIPYIWNNQQVSFDARDITDKSPYKYLACPLAREVIPHKDILYGNQEKWGNKGICVEGTTDVWRLGGKAFATSGIKFTTPQVRAISKVFKRVFIIFDGEEAEAIKQARKLKRQLEFHGVKAFIEKIEGDPGSMKQDDANHLVKTLLK